MNNELQLTTKTYRATFTGIEILGKSTKEEWEWYGQGLRMVEEAKQWAIGDWLCDGKKHYGDGLYEKASKILGMEEIRLRQFKSISEKYEMFCRQNKLSYTHYQEASVITKLATNKKGKLELSDETDMDKIQDFLKKAEKEKWTVRDLRDQVSRYKKQQQEEIRLANEPEKYSVIYADPPWKYDNSGFEMSAEKQYDVMETGDICRMRIPSAENSICFMWVTNPLLEDGLRVMSEWGFEYKTNMVWVKDNHTAGFYVFGQHELLLIGIKGSGNLPEEKFKSIITGDNRVHSKKPDCVYEMIEAMFPVGKKLEMFARNKREGWNSYGNEI
jgi:N6-adenosine-specific RNA methylase IME4